MSDALYYPNLQTLSDVVAFHARRQPDHLAIVCGDRALTYGQLHADSNRTARALHGMGVRPGDRVAYLGKESERYYDLLFGCAKSGAVLVPVNWRLTALEVGHILRDSSTKVLFVESEYSAVADELRPDLPALLDVIPLHGSGQSGAGFDEWRAASPADDLDPISGPDDAIAQLYTSGTTGLPKGVVLAQRSFFRIRDALASQGLDWIDWRPGDVSLIGIPGFHIGGLWWASQGFAAGITNVAMPMFVSATAVELIRSRRITTACVVPAMLQMMLAEPGVGRADFKTLRKVVYGGSPIAEALLERCVEEIGCDFAQIYGLTETGNTAVCLPPDDHSVGGRRMRAAGRPYPGVRLKIVDEEGRQLPAGEVGEVCIETPARMLGYWRLPEATAKTLVNGWVHTGDAGYLDADGYLYICDRIKDMIIVAGENVYPAEVENALSRHPAVAEAAVVGIPDERWGEAIHAFVALRPGRHASPRDLMLSMRSTIADFKLPTSYEFIDRLPRNPSGKILRRVLRDRFWEHSSCKVG